MWDSVFIEYIRMNKDTIRAMMQEMRASLDEDAMWLASEAIVEKISGLSAYQKARTVLFYCPFNNEVEITALIKQAFSQKKVCLPRVGPDEGAMTARRVYDLSEAEIDRYGILAPPEDAPEEAPQDIDFVAVPLVAFDENLHRIGYGGGYYDRFLPKCVNAFKCGVAYSFQKIPKIDADAHDMKLDMVVTDI